jgi:hypothetical protein
MCVDVFLLPTYFFGVLPDLVLMMNGFCWLVGMMTAFLSCCDPCIWEKYCVVYVVVKFHTHNMMLRYNICMAYLLTELSPS